MNTQKFVKVENGNLEFAIKTAQDYFSNTFPKQFKDIAYFGESHNSNSNHNYSTADFNNETKFLVIHDGFGIEGKVESKDNWEFIIKGQFEQLPVEIPKGFVNPSIQLMDNIPAGDNPFWHDSMSMGTDLVRGWIVMHPGFDNKENPLPIGWVYLVNTRTGQRIKIALPEIE